VRCSALVVGALASAALALSGCETTAEESARLQRAAKHHSAPAARGLSITAQSTKVKVIASAVLHSSEGAAAVVTLRNASAAPLRDVPVEITLRDVAGAPVYSNDVPGLSGTLVSVPLLGAHATVTWIDDQIQASKTPASVSVKVGEGAPATGAIPRLRVEGAHVAEEAGEPGVEGSLVNGSAVSQQELVIDAVARRSGSIVAAGRAVLAQAPAHARTHFQLFFIGNPHGARLEVSAPATTAG